MLCRRHRITCWRVDHNHTGLGGGVNVNVIDPHAGAPDNAQAFASADHLCCNGGATAHQQRIIGGDGFNQLRRG